MFKRHVEQQEKVLTEVISCTKRLVEKSQAMSKEVGGLFSLFNGWSVSETTAPDQNPDFLATLAQTSMFLMSRVRMPSLSTICEQQLL